MTEPKPFTGESAYQRRKRLEREGHAWWGGTPAVKPAETDQEPEPKTELEQLIATTPRNELEQLIDEFGDDMNFVELAKQRLEPKQAETDQEALKAEYRSRLDKIPTGPTRAQKILNLQRELRDRGLEELP